MLAAADVRAEIKTGWVIGPFANNKKHANSIRTVFFNLIKTGLFQRRYIYGGNRPYKFFLPPLCLLALLYADALLSVLLLLFFTLESMILLTGCWELSVLSYLYVYLCLR